MYFFEDKLRPPFMRAALIIYSRFYAAKRLIYSVFFPPSFHQRLILRIRNRAKRREPLAAVLLLRLKLPIHRCINKNPGSFPLAVFAVFLSLRG